MPYTHPLRGLRLALAAAALLPFVGCKWLEDHGVGGKDGNARRPGGGQLKEAQPEQFVSYLNEHASRLRSITYANVLVTATDRSGALPSPPITLRGDMFACQPRNFCLAVTGGMVPATAYLGSNDQQFWVYAKVPTQDPMYVFASHTDFADGRARTPGGIPFEPEWVMQALGMVTFAPPDDMPGRTPGMAGNKYDVKIDNSKRTYTLSWPAVVPNGTAKGVAVVKEIVFEGDQDIGNRPRVKRHIVRDAQSNKLICTAEIKAVKTWPANPDAKPAANGGASAADARTGPPPVQYPTKVLLRWEEQKFELELEVQNAKINQPLTADETRRRFSRPNIPGTNPINLAGG